MSVQGVAIASLIFALITLTVSVLLAVLIFSPDTTEPSPQPRPKPGPKPGPAPGTQDPTMVTISAIKRDFKGPGHSNTKQYYIVPLHNFTAEHNYMFLQPSNSLQNKFMLQISDTGTGTDRCDFEVVLFDKQLPVIYKTVDVLPQDNPPRWSGPRLTATRDHDATIDVTKVEACVVPGQTYTLALLLTFNPNVGTDDFVTYIAPSFVITQTTSAAPAGCK